MTGVIDALVVTLGLDPKGFVKGTQQTNAALVKTREGAIKEGKQVERSLDNASEAVERLARNALKLAAIFTGGRALGTFITDIGRADAAMGRMADRLGVAPERVAAFDNAIKRMGGSAGEGAAAFQRMSDTVNELRSTGNSSALPALAKLQAMSGQQIRLNGETEESLGDLAEAAKRASERVGAARASFELRSAGYSDAAINQLLKGRAELQKALAQSQRSGLVSKADADAARALGAQYEDLSDKVADFGRRISTALTPILTDLMKRFGDWIDKNKEWLAQDVATEVGKFATELRKIPWDDVAKGIKEFVKGANDGAQAVGGWTRVAEIFFGLWIGSKVVGVLASIAAIRNALVIGDTSLLAAMARVGIPVAIGAIATGHGFQTPEQAAKDPDQAQLQREGIDRRARVRGWLGDRYDDVRRFGRRLLGGGSAEAEEGRGGAGIRRRARRSLESDKETPAPATATDDAGNVTVNGHRYRPGAATAQGKANVASWLDFAQRPTEQDGLGLPADKARAIVAGLQGESSANLNPRSMGDYKDPVNRIGPTAFGTAQWRLDRAEGLRRTAAEMGTDWTDIKAQQAWMRKEMLQGRYRNVYDDIKSAPTGEAALRAYINRYENPAKKELAYAFRKPYLDHLRRNAERDAQHAKDVQTIRDSATGVRKPEPSTFPNGAPRILKPNSMPDAPGQTMEEANRARARKPDVLADPKDERRKPVASLFWGETPPAAQIGARTVVAQAQSAVADRAAVTQNDNRSTSTSTQEAHFHGDMVFNNAGDSREIASNLRARLKEPQFVSAANTGQA